VSIYIAGTPYEASPPPAPHMNCLTDDCNGMVVRHSLGCGLSVRRCTRCFSRYEVGSPAAKGQSAFSRRLHQFLSWREED
jgi:hypothetical protein